MSLTGRKIILGVTGGIAAYKAAELCSALARSGAQVRVAMSHGATKFVAPLTFEALSQHPVYLSMTDGARAWEMEHISWAAWADAMLIAPASADSIARMAAGFADDVVCGLYLTAQVPVIIAPAMNTRMLEHPATIQNLTVLRQRGCLVVEPDSGSLACGEVGAGRLAMLESILQKLATVLTDAPIKIPRQVTPVAAPLASGPPDSTLAGRTVVITSGPTREYLDPVRYISNPSSGKMGAALAREAARRGAKVHVVTGPVDPAQIPSECADIHTVETAEQMLQAVQKLADQADLFIFAAAVGDFRITHPLSTKIKRTGNAISLPLVENPDISQVIGHSKRPAQIACGFAAETDDLEVNSRAKMERKNLDAIAANNVADASIGFNSDENEVTVYLRGREPIYIAKSSKENVAREILRALVPLLN